MERWIDGKKRREDMTCLERCSPRLHCCYRCPVVGLPADHSVADLDLGPAAAVVHPTRHVRQHSFALRNGDR